MKPVSQILERPLITEKSVRQSQDGQYTFRCKKSANKVEIKEAVELVYDVKVADVNTLIVKGKAKRVGKGRHGRTSDWKKAIVKVSPESRATRLKEIFEGA